MNHVLKRTKREKKKTKTKLSSIRMTEQLSRGRTERSTEKQKINFGTNVEVNM